MASCSDKKSNGNNDKDNITLEVSIIQLIANPAEYHGKKIQIHGVGNLSYEGTSVYLSIDNWYYMSSKNAIWVSMDSEMIDGELWYYINGELISYEDAQKYNGKYVLIDGTFDMDETGHRGGFSGMIYDITRFSDFSDMYRGMNMSNYSEYIGDVDEWYESQ